MPRPYEAVYIFDSALEDDAINERLDRFHGLLQLDPAATNVDRWGRRQLAYKIGSKDTGYYVVARFKAEGKVLPEFERALKLDDSVIRHLIVLNEGAQIAPTPTAKDGEEEE